MDTGEKSLDVPRGTNRRGFKRGRIDPVTCEKNYSDADREFMLACDARKRELRKPVLEWWEVLRVAKRLGYVRHPELTKYRRQHSVLVQSSDGKYYQDPTFVGIDWYMKVTDDGTEVVTRKFDKATLTQKLLDLGIHFKTLGRSRMDFRVIDSELEQVTLYEIDLLGPVPTPHRYTSCVDSPATLSDMIWDLKVPKKDILSILEGREIPQYLGSIALKSALLLPQAQLDERRRSIVRWIKLRIDDKDSLPDMVLLKK